MKQVLLLREEFIGVMPFLWSAYSQAMQIMSNPLHGLFLLVLFENDKHDSQFNYIIMTGLTER